MSQPIQITMMLLIMFIAFSHPLMLVIVLIAQTLPAVMMINYSQDTNWLSYMLFLIFLGGLLVIFTYLSALIPNEVFSLSVPPTLLLMAMSATMLGKMNPMDLKQESMMKLSMFALTNTSTTIPMMITYLLSALCVTMFMCSKMKSPLKQNNN